MNTFAYVYFPLESTRTGTIVVLFQNRQKHISFAVQPQLPLTGCVVCEVFTAKKSSSNRKHRLFCVPQYKHVPTSGFMLVDCGHATFLGLLIVHKPLTQN
jgi:hypothetical protein